MFAFAEGNRQELKRKSTKDLRTLGGRHQEILSACSPRPRILILTGLRPMQQPEALESGLWSMLLSVPLCSRGPFPVEDHVMVVVSQKV